MYFLIDGNNLAGELNLLDEKDFDEIVTDLIRDFIDESKKKAILVFDGNSQMGESFSENGLQIYYSANDSRYQSADDKIVDLAQELDPDEGITLVTSDNEIRIEIEALNREQDRRNDIQLLRCNEFKHSLIKDEDIEEEEDDSLSEKEIENINNELMEEWS